MSAIVPLLVMDSSWNSISSPIVNENIWTVPTSPDNTNSFVRATFGLASLSSATGQQAFMSLTATDPAGNSRTIFSPSIQSGAAAYAVGALIVPPGGSVFLSVGPPEGDTFLSAVNYSVALETL